MKMQGLNGDGEVLNSMYVEHDAVPAPWADDGRTRQEFKEECDINVLMARYEKTGVINHFSPGSPQYMDLTSFPDDLAGAMLVMEMAKESFMRLPAVTRREFDNDPVAFAEFAADAANLDQMREWGLAPPATAPVTVSEPMAAPLGAAIPPSEPSAK